MAKIFISGAGGFLGQKLIEMFDDTDKLITPSSKVLDLRDRTATETYIENSRPDIIIHLAARVGGIQANQKYPGTFFYDNLTMGMNLIHAAMLYKVKKFVQIGSVCEYPKYTPVPFKEENLWDGYPEETNAAYGISKKALLVMLQSYRQQYGLNGIHLMPTNLYGPGDNFNPNTSHVIASLIEKFIMARRQNAPEVFVWGNGQATREFLHVSDCAKAIMLATANYDGDEPINLGSGEQISIFNLANMIRNMTDYQGNIVWDINKPNGQPARWLDVSKAYAAFGFKASINIEDGVRETIQWVEKQI